MVSIKKIGEMNCINFFKKVLKTDNVLLQHRFPFLLGDVSKKTNKQSKLPVDAYFPDYKLVVEYMGKQHFKPNKLMDRREGRTEQRKRYDELRVIKCKENGLKLIQFRYDDKLDEDTVNPKLSDVRIYP